MNDKNHFRDRMDMEIKLSLEAIKVAKHELQLATNWGYKLKAEKEELDRLHLKHKKSNEGVVGHLKK